MTRVLITRQDGTRRVVEVSRSGKVKSDQPACETCQGSRVVAAWMGEARNQRETGGAR